MSGTSAHRLLQTGQCYGLVDNCQKIRHSETVAGFAAMLVESEKLHKISKLSSQGLPWFALRVRSNYERVAGSHLRGRGYEEFSPSYKAQRRWSDRNKEIDQFLFPGYVFCRFNPLERLPILTVPGVVGLIGFGRVPAPIPDEEIERVRRMVESGLLVTPWPYLELGQTVLIEHGPLAGVEGILEEVKGKCRLVVSVNLLKRSVSAEVERSCVRPVKSTSPDSRRMLVEESH